MVRCKSYLSLLTFYVTLIYVKGDDLQGLSAKVKWLTDENTKVWKVLSSFNQFCLLYGKGKCGPCKCRDNYKLPSRYYCDCQGLTPERDCRAFNERGVNINGLYKVHQNNLKLIQVWCDQTTDGGGWTVIQRRRDGSENFIRNWHEYKNGFGDLTNEFWLGNQNIFTLLHQAKYPKGSELRIDMNEFLGKKCYAKYTGFSVDDEMAKYKMHVSGFTGNCGDSFGYHGDNFFSTYDQDNDKSSGSCAHEFKGGWWYRSCHYSNLNGLYYQYGEFTDKSPYATGLHWYTNDKDKRSLKFTEMKIRRN